VGYATNGTPLSAYSIARQKRRLAGGVRVLATRGLSTLEVVHFRVDGVYVIWRRTKPRSSATKRFKKPKNATGAG
jgi:hypothetical protein